MVPTSVDDTTKTKTQEATVWILGDRRGRRQEQLENAGWKTGISKCSNIGADTRHNLLLKMAEAKPRLLYIVEFGGMGNSVSSSSFLENLIDEQLRLCGLI